MLRPHCPLDPQTLSLSPGEILPDLLHMFPILTPWGGGRGVGTKPSDGVVLLAVDGAHVLLATHEGPPSCRAVLVHRSCFSIGGGSRHKNRGGGGGPNWICGGGGGG